MIPSNNIEEELKKLEAFDKIFIEAFKQLFTPNEEFFSLDILVVGVINRSLSLCSGFCLLVKEKNFIAASHLVRPYLDNYLRFHAVWLVSDPHDFAHRIIKGERIDRIRDRKNNLLRDSYLAQEAAKNHPWMLNVYNETSGFIHLSKKHLSVSMILKDKQARLGEFGVSKNDLYIPDELRLEAIACMIDISECILTLINGWISTKSHRDS